MFIKRFIAILLLLSFSVLGKSQSNSRWGIGTSINVVGLYRTNGGLGTAVFPQFNAQFFTRPNQLLSFGLGAYFNGNRFVNPTWLTLNYQLLINYNKKKKSHLFYGGRMDIGVGQFIYAEQEPRVIVTRGYYKRLLLGVSPEFGGLIKTGKRSFLKTSLSIGLAGTFWKLSQAPGNSYTYPRIILPLSFKIDYCYLLKTK